MNIIKTAKIFALAALAACQAASAQDAQSTVFAKTRGNFANKMVCGIEFLNGTSVYINIQTIASVSKQNYIAGPLEVSEIVIDTTGNSQIRIYNARPVDPQKQAEILSNKMPADLKSKASPAMQTLVEKANAAKDKIPFAQEAEKNASLSNVYKIYPSTTHSKTLEFTVSSKDALDSLYTQFSGAFCSQNNETLSQALFSEK
ncbi:MAG: hypothetical protein IKO42_08250 [Opitutales bacterium]|nr:hypothetical protein [Opitutales bacterium]